MAVWESRNIVLTDLGRSLLSSVELGDATLEITKVVASNSYFTTNLAQVTSLVEVQRITIDSTSVSDSGSVLHLSMTNEDVSSAYNLRTIGIYAKKQGVADTEVLYMIAQNSGSNGEEIPAFTTAAVALSFDFYIIHSQTTPVSITLQRTGYVSNGTFSDYQELMAQNLSVINGNISNLDRKITQDTTPASLLEKIKTVDGSESGLDADLLDGYEGAHYENPPYYNNTPQSPTTSGSSGTSPSVSRGDHKHPLPTKSQLVSIGLQRTVLFGTSEPNSDLGEDGDIYIMLDE